MEETMTFGQVIDICRKENKKIRRVGWNNGELYVEYNNKEVPTPGGNRKVYFILHFIDHKTNRHVMRMGWSPSQEDLVAEDWFFTSEN